MVHRFQTAFVAMLVMLVWGHAALAGPHVVVSAPTTQLEQKVREIITEAGPRLAEWLGGEPELIRVRVADSRSDFDAAAAKLGGPQWAGALAVPGRSLILIRSPKQLSDPFRFKPILIHEMAHLYLAAALRGVRAPLWLEEGLAMYAAGESGWSRTMTMTGAVLSGRLLDLQEISLRFPTEAGAAELAYAQSYYLISFLLQKYGPEVLSDVVLGLRQGLGVSAALRRATGLGLHAIQQAFFSHLGARFSWLGWLTSGNTLWAAIGLLAAVGLVLRWRTLRSKRQRMDIDPKEHDLAQVRNWPPPQRRGDVLGEAGLGPERNNNHDGSD